MRKISDLIEDPRTAEGIQEDIKEAAEDVWKASRIEDATCHTEVHYQLISKLKQMCESALKEMDKQRTRAYHRDEEFVMVAGYAAGLDGFALSSSLVNAIHELAILIDYEWWIDEHKEPRPEPME
jgi:hypothetical protein